MTTMTTLRLTLSAAACLLFLCPASAQYELVWNDEFEGTALDERAWNIEVNGDGGGNQELQYYCREGVSVQRDPKTGAGCLVLTAKRQPRNGKSFTSGRVNTMDNLYFIYGKVEARIRMPHTANGLWPAFWMLGNDYRQVGWPRCGEIDIVEMGNATGISHGTQDRYFNGACHWGFYNQQGQYPNYGRSTTSAYSLQDDEFHLFTAIWDDEKISMYLDLDRNPQAKPYYEMTITDTSGDWSTGRYFHHDFFIVFDLAIGGYFTGILQPAAITALPDDGSEQSMWIDYVRLYQRSDLSFVTLPDGYESGVTSTTADHVATTTAVYDLSGRRLADIPGRQVCLMRTADGVKKVYKRR